MKYGSDVELARRCAEGDEQAWERFVLEFRPLLYRAADALDPTGGARDVADALYADLYGVGSHANRRSLFRSFQGRSSLATWLRAVLAQRYVDRLRSERRLTRLPDVENADGRGTSRRLVVDPQPADPSRAHRVSLLCGALQDAVRRLTPRDRLRLGCYYAQNLTLAETGRVTAEHEATVSRQLSRTRADIRRDVERRLREVEGLNDAQIEECFAAVVEDPGEVDLNDMLNVGRGSGVPSATVVGETIR